MKIRILHGPSTPMANILLGADETILAVSYAFVGMTSGVDVKTRVRSGQIRSFIPGQSHPEAFFLNSYRSQGPKEEVFLAPRLPGEVYVHVLKADDNPLLVRPGAFLAADESIKIDTIWYGGSSVKASEGLRLLRCSGMGSLILSCFGALHQRELKGEQSYVIDTGHIVAVDDQMRIRLRRLGGLKTVRLAGEEMVAELQGPGQLHMQTRSWDEFRRWLQIGDLS